MSGRMAAAVRKALYLVAALAIFQLVTIAYTAVFSDIRGIALVWHILIDTIETFAYIALVGFLSAFIFYSSLGRSRT